jgi:hypothetical protein
MGWDGMGWDGMGWDGMGWDGMGRSGVGGVVWVLLRPVLARHAPEPPAGQPRSPAAPQPRSQQPSSSATPQPRLPARHQPPTPARLALPQVALWDVLEGRAVRQYGRVDFAAQEAALFQPLSVPGWFTSDNKSGCLALHLEPGSCFAAEAYALSLGLQVRWRWGWQGAGGWLGVAEPLACVRLRAPAHQERWDSCPGASPWDWPAPPP